MGALAVAECAWSACGDTLQWEVGVAGWVWSLHGKQTAMTGSLRADWGRSSKIYFQQCRCISVLYWLS